MTVSSAIAQINAHLKKYPSVKSYSSWYVGITDDPPRRKSEHTSEGDFTGAWFAIDTGSETTARAVEKHFLDLGCKGGAGGGYDPTYVYVF